MLNQMTKKNTYLKKETFTSLDLVRKDLFYLLVKQIMVKYSQQLKVLLACLHLISPVHHFNIMFVAKMQQCKDI